MTTWFDPGQAPPIGEMPEVPEFLRRALDPQKPRPLGALQEPKRTWIMPDKTRKENALINYPISDPSKPVEVWARDHNEAVKRFPDMKAFYNWYKPKVHGYLGAREISTGIVIFLENASDVAAPAGGIAASQAVTEKEPRAPRTAGSSTVTVDGTSYRSVLAAFEALKLPINKHQKFRAELKKAGKLTFTHDGRGYAFETGVA